MKNILPSPINLFRFSLLASAILLTACGGGTNNNTQSPTSPNVLDEPKKPNPPIENKDVLANTEKLPALPNNPNPLQDEGDIASIKALQQGVYSSRTITLSGTRDEVKECPSGGRVYCAAIDKYRLVNGKIEGATWVYLPKSQKWIELDSKATQFYSPFSYADIYSDGKTWNTAGFDTENTQATVKNNTLNYKYGAAEFAFLGLEVPLAEIGKVLENEVNYSNTAFAYTFMAKLTKGQYLALSESPNWGTYADKRSYSSLAEFRKAHADPQNPVCLVASNWDEAVAFDPKKTGVKLYTVDPACGGLAQATTTVLSEGVKKIDDRQVIYLAQQKKTPSSGEETSSTQFLWVFTLNDNGIPIQGTAYQPGYGVLLPDLLFNKQAIVEWLAQDFQYDSKLDLP